MRLSKILFPIILIAAAVSCQSMFSNDNGIDVSVQSTQTKEQTTTFNGDTLVFTRFVMGQPPRDYPPFTSEVKNQKIVINGYYLAPVGFTPEASFSQNDNRITILLKWPEDDKVSPTIPIGYFYDAYISNLEKGEYTIKIVHKYDLMRGQEGEKHTVFKKEFVIE